LLFRNDMIVDESDYVVDVAASASWLNVSIYSLFCIIWLL
jgi:hypothetical protein